MLEPVAIDAAFDDETMPDLTDRILRRDSRHDACTALIQNDDSALLRSLAIQLDELVERQREMQRLLDVALTS